MQIYTLSRIYFISPVERPFFVCSKPLLSCIAMWLRRIMFTRLRARQHCITGNKAIRYVCFLQILLKGVFAKEYQLRSFQTCDISRSLMLLMRFIATNEPTKR